jgi:hypothetical protein
MINNMLFPMPPSPQNCQLAEGVALKINNLSVAEFWIDFLSRGLKVFPSDGMKKWKY